jgi:hypothetical protein
VKAAPTIPGGIKSHWQVIVEGGVASAALVMTGANEPLTEAEALDLEYQINGGR